MRTLFVLVFMLLALAPTLGQDAPELDLRKNPTFTPEVIQSNFVLKNWILRRTVFEVGDKGNTCTTVFYSYLKESRWEDQVACGWAKKRLERDNEGLDPEHQHRGLTLISVFKNNRELKEQKEENGLLRVASHNIIVVGYYHNDEFEATLAPSNKAANGIISDIYSVSKGGKISQVGEWRVK
ncbi:MAG TPA: hypothetical protein VGC58_01940 [Candidatus Paceibacterota bacterium]